MSLKNKWLIKSDYKVLGPYSYEQVEELIMRKQISIIDEIRDMNIRWSYIREVSEFKGLAEVVRKDIDEKSELTQTLQTTFQKTTSGTALDLQSTKTDSSIFTGIDFGQNEKNSFKKDSEFVTPKFPSEDLYNKPSINNLNHIENKKSSRVLKTIVGIICIFALTSGGWFYLNNLNQNKHEKLFFQQIRKFNMYGLDNKSIELFKKLPQDSQDKIAPDIIPLWIKLEAAGAFDQKRIIDFYTKDKISGNERKAQYQLIKFNKALSLGDTENAKDSLIRAIDLDPSSVIAKENDAIFSFLQKKYQESSKIFKNLYDKSNQGRFLYGYILSSINSKILNPKNAFEMIEKHINSRVDFNKELLFLQLYIIKQNPIFSDETYNRYYSLFVEFPFHFSKLFKIENLINQEIYNIEYLEKIKQEIIRLDPKNGSMINLQFLIEKGNFEFAQDFFKKNIQQFNETEKNNLNIILQYLNKSNQILNLDVIIEKNLYLSTVLYLLKINIDAKSSQTLQLKYVNILMKKNQLFSNWAQLVSSKQPEDKDQIRSLINSDKIYMNDFLPYLEFKASLNE